MLSIIKQKISPDDKSLVQRSREKQTTGDVIGPDGLDD